MDNPVFFSLFPARSWQGSANIDIQLVATILCQYWQNFTRIRQKITDFIKTRLHILITFHLRLAKEERSTQSSFSRHLHQYESFEIQIYDMIKMLR